MKHRIQQSALILTLSMGACISEDILSEKTIEKENEVTNIVAVIGKINTESDKSRTSVTMGLFGSDDATLVWADKDTIGIYPTEGDQLSFPIVEGVGTNSCKFNGGGWGLKSSTLYTAYSPFNRSYYFKSKEELPFSILGQEQSSNGNSNHLGKYDLQISQGQPAEKGGIIFSFEHQVCFLRMDLIIPTNAIWESVTLESDALFTTETSMNLSLNKPILTNKSYSNFVTLNLNDIELTSGNTLTAYMVVLPIDLREQELKVKLTDNKGNTYTSNATIANNYRNFKAGYSRWIKAENFQLTGITMHLNEPGTLAINNQSLTSLKITGKLNGTDVLTIRNYLGFDMGEGYTKHSSSLEYLDLSEAQIVSGGDFYCYIPGTDGESTCYTNNSTIGKYMFHDLTNLKHIILPQSTTMIEEYAFYGCTSLKSVHIPDNTTTIKDAAFYGCTNLTNVLLSKNLTRIGRSAFESCSSLKNITLPISLTAIDGQAFYKCSSLTSINLPPNLSLSGITNNYIFASCTSLNNVSISPGIKVIPQDIFRECTSLKEITIPSSVNTIEGLAFYRSGLEKVYIHCTTPPTMITSFYEIPSTCVLYVPKGCVDTYKNSTGWNTSFSDIKEIEE